MPKQCRHISGIHPIILQNAEAQALFVFVRAVLSVAPQTEIAEIIRLFEVEFGIEELNRKSAKVRYYRMLQTYMNNKNLFNHDTRNTSGNGKNGHVLKPGLGTASAS